MGWILVLGVVFVSCRSNPLMLPAVGPSTSNSSRRPGHGSLQVYTALTERNDGGVRYYYPQNYVIYQTNTLVKSVVNSVLMAEQPAVVDLPAGDYLVRGPADGYGWVQVPVVIKAGLLTEVHLDRQWRPKGWKSATNLAVMPDGAPIGLKPRVLEEHRRSK